MDRVYNIKEVSPGVWQLPVPLPAFVPANVYLIEDEVLTLIDAGHPLGVTSGVLEQHLKALGYTFEDIDQIIYTHHHIDHTGGGSVLSQNHQVKHLIYCDIADSLRDIDKLYDPLRNHPRELVRHYPVFEDFVQADKKMQRYIDSYPMHDPIVGAIEGLQDGQIINLGKKKLRVIHTPGHCLDDISLFDSESGLLFGGDTLLKAGITFTFVDGSDVVNYLNSLEKLSEYDNQVKLILPGHGEPISTGLQALRTKLRKGVMFRADKFAKYLAVNGPSSAIDIFKHFYGKELNHARWPGIFCIMLTYLKFLQASGRAEEIEPGTFALVGV